MTRGTLARAGVIVMGAYLASRVLGWVRLVVITNLFSAGPELDAYFAAFRIPDLIYQLVAAGALSSALVPVLARLHHAGERDRADRVVSTVINAMVLVLAVVAVVGFVFAPDLVPLIAPGFDAATMQTTVALTRVMLVSPILLAVGAVASSVLNLEGRFAAAALAPVAYNAAIIVCALTLTPWLGVESLAVGVVIGSILHVAVQLPQLRHWFRYRRLLDLADAATQRILRLIAPRAVGLAASQITFIVNTTLATTVSVGALSVYTVAFTIFLIPVGVIGMPLGVLLLPSLSRSMAAGNLDDYGSLLMGALRALVYVMAFFSLVGIVIAPQVVGALFGFGAFDAAGLELAAQTLAVLLAGLVASAVDVVLARAFYSDQDTTTPVVGVVISVAVNVVVSLLTVERYGLLGLAAGVAIGDWVELVFLAVMLRRRVPTLGMRALAAAFAVMALGGGLAAAAALAVVVGSAALVPGAQGTVWSLTQAVAATAAGAAVYLLYTRSMRLPELPRAMGLIREAIRRPGSSP